MTGSSPTRRVVSSDGLQLATVDHAGADSEMPLILLVHATGFCKEVWAPVVDDLRSSGWEGPVLAIDQRAHGSSMRSAPPFDWRDGARDVLAAIPRREGVLGVGHSSGGAHLLIAEVERPGTFAALVVIEPIVFPPPFRRLDESPLALAALRRRYRFAGPEEAFASFRGRGPFARWDDRALKAYCDGCLRPEADHWVLKCHPEDEAEFYRTGAAHDVWNRLGEVDCPVVLVAGSDSDTHPPDVVRALAERIPDCRVVSVQDATHFVPMERPELVAGIVAAEAKRTGGYRWSGP